MERMRAGVGVGGRLGCLFIEALGKRVLRSATSTYRAGYDDFRFAVDLVGHPAIAVTSLPLSLDHYSRSNWLCAVSVQGVASQGPGASCCRLRLAALRVCRPGRAPRSPHW